MKGKYNGCKLPESHCSSLVKCTQEEYYDHDESSDPGLLHSIMAKTGKIYKC